MNHSELAAAFDTLTTPHIADACMRLNILVRAATGQLTPVGHTASVAGPAMPVVHAGSVDVVLEAIDSADPGDVIVVDNQARTDEACVGDLLILEADRAGMAGMLVYGYHRDSAELSDIGMPVWSCGAYPVGPTGARTVDSGPNACWGDSSVARSDVIIADVDGAIAIPADQADQADQVATTARGIRDIERAQADRVRRGESLRSQFEFDVYLANRADGIGFREHLRSLGREIEE